MPPDRAPPLTSLTTFQATLIRRVGGDWQVTCEELTNWPDGRGRRSRLLVTEAYGTKEAAKGAAERLAKAMGYLEDAIVWL